MIIQGTLNSNNDFVAPRKPVAFDDINGILVEGTIDSSNNFVYATRASASVTEGNLTVFGNLTANGEFVRPTKATARLKINDLWFEGTVDQANNFSQPLNPIVYQDTVVNGLTVNIMGSLNSSNTFVPFQKSTVFQIINSEQEIPLTIPNTPAYSGHSSISATTSAATVSPNVNTALAGSFSENDIMFAVAYCQGGAGTPITCSGSWAEVSNFDIGTSRMAVFWKRRAATESNPSIGSVARIETNLLCVHIVAFSGCITTGTPFENVITSGNGTGQAIGPNVLVSRSGCLAVNLFTRHGNTAYAVSSAWSEHTDFGTSGGGGCRFANDSNPMPFPGTAPGCISSTVNNPWGCVGLALIGSEEALVIPDKTFRRALWVWDAHTLLGNIDEENILLNECLNTGITDLYLYTPVAAWPSKTADYTAFINRANALDIRCWGLDGDTAWFTPNDGPPDLYTSIINAFDNLPGLYGFQIDMEPFSLTAFHAGTASSALSTTPGSGVWQDTAALDREMLMRDWITIHQQCRNLCNSYQRQLGSALPDSLNDYFGEPITCTFNGETKNVFEHLATRIDNIALMTYNTNPQNVILRARYEMNESYEASGNPQVGYSIETHTGVGSGISYGDTAGKQTKAAALADMAIIKGQFEGNPSFVYENIHDWTNGWKSLSPASVDTSDPLA